MGKFYVPPVALTPADRLRAALGQAENRIIDMRGSGARALEALHLFDQATESLQELREAGMDVRAEQVRFETLQRQLQTRKKQLVREVGQALKEERALVGPDRTHWWWFLDEEVAQERADRLRRVLIGVGVSVVAAVVLWFLYDRFIAPPRNVRQAMSFVASAEAAIDGGEVEAALPSFQQAVELDPEDPDNWVWLGVAHEQLGQEAEAQAAFDEGRDLYDSDLQFLLSRGMKYLRVGDIEAASSDLNQAVEQYPDAGWAYTVRANVWVAQGDYARAVADLDKASELAAAAEDTQLEAYARTQRAMVIQLQAAQPFPATDEPESTE